MTVSSVVERAAVSSGTPLDPRRWAGAAGAVVSASQQVGGSFGTALLSTIAVAAVTDYVSSNAAGPLTQLEAMVHSYQVGLVWAAGFLMVAGLVVLALVRGGRQTPVTEGASVHFG